MRLLISIIFFLLILNEISLAQNKKAFTNGRIFTLNERHPFAEAVVVEGNKIVFVGLGKDMMNHIDGKTEIIDLKKKLMLPGFIDNHVHFTSGGFYLLGIDLRPAKSTGEFKQILKEYVKSHEGKWITGGHWEHEAWEGN